MQEENLRQGSEKENAFAVERKIGPSCLRACPGEELAGMKLPSYSGVLCSLLLLRAGEEMKRIFLLGYRSDRAETCLL